MSHHHAHSQSDPWRDLPEEFATHLALEAKLNEPLVTAIIDRAEAALTDAPATILDLGSGTGAGTVALAQRFPQARVHALDVSTQLLDKVRAAAEDAEVADRIEPHEVDLDQDWPADIPKSVDLAWAALSLHHVADPIRALRNVYESLRPGGVFILTELTGQSAFGPDDLGSGLAGLRDRIAEAAPAHAHHGDVPWNELLKATGFTATRFEHEFTASADIETGAQYLARQLQAQRSHLAHRLNGEDLAAFDDVLQSVAAGTSPLTFTSGRAVWVAVRPEQDDELDAEIAVIGGGSAGLSAAIAAARSRRNVVVIDAGQPRNAPADGAHNVLGQEGISPLEIVAKGSKEAQSYGVRIIEGRATGATGQIDDFTVEVEGGRRVHARRLILASGLVDDLPDIPGVQAGWGVSVLHCPFCHGWEVRDQRIAVLSRDEVAVHQALLFRQLSEHVTVFRHEASAPTAEQQAQLDALSIEVIDTPVQELVMDGAQVRSITLIDGSSHPIDAAVVAPRFNARTELYEALGGQAEDTPFGIQIPTNPMGQTEVPGVWAAGNANNQMAMVTASAAAGVSTGAAVHGDLAFTDLGNEVRARGAGAESPTES